MGSEARRRQVLVHQPIDQGAKEVEAPALGAGKHIQRWRLVTPPAVEGLGDIGREIDEADPPSLSPD
jgi:hypothetical protein